MNCLISCIGCDITPIYAALADRDFLYLTLCPDGFILNFEEIDLSQTAQALSFAAISALPKCVIEQNVDRSLCESDRLGAVSAALYEIYDDLDLVDLERTLISNCYHQLLSESDRIDLLGAVRFRLPHVYSRWANAARRMVQSGENTAYEILDFLSQYAENVLSEIKYAKILPLSGGYALVDEKGALIEEMPPTMSEFEGMAQEDILLSRLINISPQRIDASDVKNELLLLLLQRIFNDRLLL